MFDHFGFLAPLYDRIIPPPDPARLRERLALPTAGRMLDAGGGTGRASAQLRPLVGGLMISDLSRPMLERARGVGHPVQSRAERLPFPDGSFDRVLVVDALHHFVGRQREAIADLLRVLKPGGRMVIEEPDINRFVVKLVALAETLALMRSHFYSPAEIRDMVLGASPSRAQPVSARVESGEGFSAWVVVDK